LFTNHVLALSTKPPNSSRNSNSPHHERPPKKKTVSVTLSLSLSASLTEKKSDRGGEKKVQDSEDSEAEGAKLVTKKGEEPKEGTRSGASRHQIGCHLR
jgi:hypothetical protein